MTATQADYLTRYAQETRPSDHEWALDEDTALLDPTAFRRLGEYSSTLPTGAGIGKVWKARRRDGWWLGEYVDHTDPDLVGIKWRRIEIIEDHSPATAPEGGDDE